MDIKVLSSVPKGNVYISGAKNATIPLLCASILAKGRVLLRNVPRISDVYDICNILRHLECRVAFKGHTMLIDNTNLKYKPLLLDECRRIRGSYYFIGSFLTLFSKCEIWLPGGCKIGSRPIDAHLKAFIDLGYQYKIEEDILTIYKAKTISKAGISLIKKSVGASINAVLAALCLDECVIENTLFEPEGLEALDFLRKIGFNIVLDKDRVTYKKNPIAFRLIKHNIIPDRMEAMTYAVLGLLNGDLTIRRVDTAALKVPLEILREAGFNISYTASEIIAKKSYGKNIYIKTGIYPGFPTDLQSIFGVLTLKSLGTSKIEECIFNDRMQIYYDLRESGVDCVIENNSCEISGVASFRAREYVACDLRHGAALLLLAIYSGEPVIIRNFDFVLRGYDDILNKMKSIGVKIQII